MSNPRRGLRSKMVSVRLSPKGSNAYHVMMVGRATRDALLKLRRAAELDARRVLEAARADLRKAQAARSRAQVALDEAETRIWRTQLRSSKAGRAGDLHARAEFLEA